MRNVLRCAVLIGLLAAPARAQVLDTQYISAASSDCSTANSCAVFQLGSAASITLQTSGTFSQTLISEATSDGQTWATVTLIDASTGLGTTAPTTGQYSLPNLGFLKVRIRASAIVSGTAKVTATAGIGLRPAQSAAIPGSCATAFTVYQGGTPPTCTTNPTFASWIGTGGQTLAMSTADVTTLSRGTNAQALRVFGNTTGSKYLELAHNGTDGKISASSGVIYFNTGSSDRWSVQPNLVPAASNTYDLGASGTTVRTGYFGTSVVGGRFLAADGAAATPGYSFGSQEVGFYRSASSEVSFSGDGAKDLSLSNTAFTVFGARPITATSGTQTTSSPLFVGTQTQNAAGVSFIGSTLTFTETASASGSRYFQILGGAAGTTDEFYVGKGGTVTAAGQFLADPTAGYSFTGTTTTKMWLTGGAVRFDIGGAAQFQVLNGAVDLQTDVIQLRFGASGDVVLRRQAAKVLNLGSATAGVALDTSTDGTLWVKSFAAADTAILKANNGTYAIVTGYGTGTSVANVGANSCGTTAATITGNQVSGVITVGATSGTQCRVTFSTAAPTARDCTANDDTTTVAVRTTPVDTSNTDFIGAFVAGDKVSYVCMVR